jgi:hypothetical protein
MGQRYWECLRMEGTHTRDTGNLQKVLSPHTHYEFQPGSCAQGCGQKQGLI